MSLERKKRLITFGDIASATEAPRPAGGSRAGEPATLERATYADLAKLSKRPEDFAEPGVPNRGALEAGIPETATAIVEPLKVAGRHVRVATRARDGHSPGEQAVYESLWSNAKPYAGNCRAIAVGYRSLSVLCGLTVNNCKANLRSLARKLAIRETEDHSYTRSKTYLVYSEGEIMKRRKAAGLTRYLKSRGVIFVDEKGVPVSGIPSTGRLDSDARAKG